MLPQRAELMTLHLHVGHGKTGSSFLQSWLALNRSGLWREANLLYLPGQADASARAGGFSMGNGDVLDHALDLYEHPQQFRRWWFRVQQQTLRAIGITHGSNAAGAVFSAERWTRQLPVRIDRLLQFADACDFEEVRIWLLVRDPLDHAVSVYGQMVKRHGFRGSLDEWLSIYDFPKVLQAFLQAVQSRSERFHLKVTHYGNERQRLLEALRQWLMLADGGDWQHPAQWTINRSLTADELLLMRWLNGHIGERAAAIGERLVDCLPQLTAARPQPSASALTRFEQHWRSTISDINASMPAHAALQMPCADESMALLPCFDQEAGQISLSTAQLDCLFEGIRSINKLSPLRRLRFKRWLKRFSSSFLSR